MAIVIQRSERDPQRIVDAIVQLTEGRQNSVGTVTLRANQTTTTVKFPNVSADSLVFLTPLTANAAAAGASSYFSSIVRGSFTITHANNAQVDKTFGFLCIGG